MSIPTYFSHSYRPEDRQSNKAIWKHFADQDFYFTVDPPTDLASHTHLETMMLRSSCFVAVVNYRKEAPPDFCSRFVLAELGLAIQSRTPKLVIVDETVPATHFDSLPRTEHVQLRLDEVSDRGEELAHLIGQLARRALTDADRLARPKNRLALLVPESHTTKAYGGERVRREIARCAELQGMVCDEVPVPARDNGPFAMTLDKYECVALDVRGEYLPEWVFAYVYGRFIPTIKLVRVRPNELASTVALPPLVNGLRMDPDEPGVESVTYWRDAADLTFQLSRILKRIVHRGTALREPDEGVTYFETLGLRPARLFVSNAGSMNDLADQLCKMLERHNIEAWQYKQPKPGTMLSGTKWPERIKQELEQCDVFVALLDHEYQKSEWCRREMRRARERAAEGSLVLLPFQVDKNISGSAIRKLVQDLQAPPVYLDGTNACQRIFEHIETQLRQDERDNQDWRQNQPLLLGASREAIVDALRHVPQASYPHLERQLRDAGIELSIRPEKRALQRRHFAEAVLGDVQKCGRISVDTLGFSSTTSVLVAVLADLAERPRKKVLESLLERIELSMAMRNV